MFLTSESNSGGEDQEELHMNLKNMPIKKTLLAGFGITIGISVLIIGAVLLMINSLRGAYKDIVDEYVGTNQLISD